METETIKTSWLKSGPLQVSLLLAGLFTAVFNFPMLMKAYEATTALEIFSWGFILSTPVFLFCAFNIIFSLLCWRWVEKVIFIPLIVLSSLLFYAAHTYGIIFDNSMIQNIFETDRQESFAYLNATPIFWGVGLGLLPAWLLYKTDILYPAWNRLVAGKALSIMLSAAVIGIIAVFYFENYATIIRNNTILQKMPIPVTALKSAYKYVRNAYFATPVIHTPLGMDAVQRDNSVDGRKDLVVMIVGETQRAKSYQLGGYEKETNPYTIKKDVTFFKNTTSCGTATAHSVPCMFSHLMRSGFSNKKALSQDNILDVLKRSGVNSHWLDNDGGCKKVCANVKTIDIRKKYSRDKNLCSDDSCYDRVFLPELAELTKKLPHQNTLLVLHVMGSHGPTYYRRYPAQFRKFMPGCARKDIENCTSEELTDEYDNTILYFDYIMAQVIDLLSAQSSKWNTSLLFMSDHGESLGEKGIYLHGMPYMVAPDEQTHIPFIGWFSDGFIADKKMDRRCVRKKADGGGYSHDNLFDTLLGMFDVATSEYRSDMDIFRSCRT